MYYNAQAVKHPTQAVCSFAQYPEAHCAFMVNLDKNHIPRSYEEAMEDKEWKESVGAEAGAMIKNDTWYESELPKGKKAVSSRWIDQSRRNTTPPQSAFLLAGTLSFSLSLSLRFL